MKSAAIRIAALATLALGAAACDTAPTAPEGGPARYNVDRLVWEALYDMTDSYFALSCGPDGEPLESGEGELIRIEGKVYERFMLLQDANGNHHVRWQKMPVGLRGVGVDSGEEFRVSERSQGGANQLSTGATGTYRDDMRMTGATTQRTFWLTFRGTYRFDAAGELVVDRATERLVCSAGRDG